MERSRSLEVAVVGASGYTGAELLRLLAGHPHVEVRGLYARRAAGLPLSEVFAQFTDVIVSDIESFDADRVAETAKVAFCALPHGQSARAVAELRERDVMVVDLSADFRLNDAATYDEWYGSEAEPTHPCPDLLADAVYGLPEFHRDALRETALAAAPGCYPTGALLAVGPLVARGLVSTDGLIVDAKSGLSGAGRSPSLGIHFPEVGEGVSAYKVAGAHRHTIEIEQELSSLAGAPVMITFTPHLVPMSRGIFSCVYGAPTDSSLRVDDYHRALVEAYADEPFVSVLPLGRLPATSHVRGSNRAHVAVAYDERVGRVLALSAIDNLNKGSSGQAIQCLNLMQGWDETAGLTGAPMFP